MTQETNFENHIREDLPLLCEPSFLNKRAALMQFDLLSARCLRRDAVGELARACVSYLLLRNGAPAHPSISNIVSHRCALLVMRLLSAPEYHETMLANIAGVLAQSKNSSLSNRLLILRGLKQSLGRIHEEPGSRKFLRNLLINALKLELTRVNCEQSREFQCELIELIELYPHPEAHAILTAIAEQSPDDLVKLNARKTLGKLSDDLGRMWIATAGDEVSSDKFLADELKQALEQDLTDLEKAQAIFNACKSQVPNKVCDPRVQLLKKLMTAADSAVLRTAGSMAYWHMQSNKGSSRK